MQDLIETPVKSGNGAEPTSSPLNEIRTDSRIVVAPDDDYNQNLVANVHPPTWENPTPGGKYNLLVIGGGSAGLVAASGAAGMGAKVALVERHLLGGDCLNVGCVPSKSVIRSSKVLGEVMRAADLGVTLPGGVDIDFEAIMRRMRRIRSEISEHDSALRFKDLGIDLYLGDGHFTGSNTFEVDGRTLTFNKALISTGSRPAVIPIPGLADVGYLTNETVFEQTVLPPRLAVIGSGPIGSELSQSFNRFGSQVTLFDVQPRVLGREDDDAAEVLRNVFESEGINLALGTQITGMETVEDGKAIHFELDGEDRIVVVDEILLAVGRAPNIETLDLEAGGIEYHQRGVTVNDMLQTTNENVYAAGDVAIKYQFTHTADATARIVLQNALFPGPNKKVSDLVVPWTTYTDPEVAHVGMYPKDAEEQGIEVETFVQSIGDIDRGKADGELDGFVKVHVKKGSDEILGATIVAGHAGEMINELTLAITAGIGLKTLATVIHPYPTQAEAIKKVADAYNRTRLTPKVHSMFKRWFAWTRRGK
jgi:pyruvate/2-oxoglutarate dehydrogenase complex dihydrolipoamide dehydrogenase (E3) component